MCRSLRITAVRTNLAGLPRCRRHWAKARIAGSWVDATTAHIESALRSLLLPDLPMKALPRTDVHDERSSGASPACATNCLTVLKRLISTSSESLRAADSSAIQGLEINNAHGDFRVSCCSMWACKRFLTSWIRVERS